MKSLSAPLLKSLSGGISQDGDHLLLQFTTANDEQFNVALDQTNVGRLLGFVIEQAAASAAIKPPQRKEWQQITTKSVAINEIAVAPGRSDTEAILSVQAGVFQMTFSTELATLIDALRNLESMTIERKNRPKPN
ncbi:MAG: hypothetical protein H7Y09_12710 [Chitinophagaceae bacterium]|nr:hypothetical protein [Anaerolineae bacterium]